MFADGTEAEPTTKPAEGNFFANRIQILNLDKLKYKQMCWD